MVKILLHAQDFTVTEMNGLIVIETHKPEINVTVTAQNSEQEKSGCLRVREKKEKTGKVIKMDLV